MPKTKEPEKAVPTRMEQAATKLRQVMTEHNVIGYPLSAADGAICTLNEGARLIRAMRKELGNALDVFRDACDCGECGPCRRQRVMVKLMNQTWGINAKDK
jgi:hypothetical protein